MRVLVVDRRRAFAEALARLLRGADLVAEHAGFQRVRGIARRFQPTLAIIDADADRDQVAEAVGAAHDNESRALLLAREAHPRYEALARRTGAVGWVTRHSSAHGLLAAVRRGHTAPAGTVRPAQVAHNHRSGPEIGVLEPLTARELEVLRHLMSGQANGELAAALGISAHTVRTHVQNILAKTGARTRLEAIALARRAGLRPAGTHPRSGAVG